MKNFKTYLIDNDQLVDNGSVEADRIDEVQKRFSDDIIAVDSDDLPADFSVDAYTIENGQLVKASPELIAERQAARQAQANQAEIAELRAYLTQTDYAAIKCGELGLSMADTYPDLHAQRTAARARINELQEGGTE